MVLMKKQTLSDINGHLFYRCLVVELLQELVALKNMVGYMYLSVTGGGERDQSCHKN